MAGCMPSGTSFVVYGKISITSSSSHASNVEDVMLSRRSGGGTCMLQSSSYKLERRMASRFTRAGCSSSTNSNVGCLHDDLGREELRRGRKSTGIWSDRCRNIFSLLPGVGGSFWEGAESDSSASERFQPRTGPIRKPRDRSVLLSLIQEIEPLDVSHISKDASVNSMDAMKRTISGMLGILPSDQFHISVEMEREPLARLLVSAMMTGYTLRNAEYRMCLQRSLELSSDASDVCQVRHFEGSSQTGRDPDDGPAMNPIPELEARRHINSQPVESSMCRREDDEAGPHGFEVPGLGDLSPEALAYIQRLQSHLTAASQELESCKKTLAELEVDNMVADDQNEVLDYLRSLDPDKVAELSQPTSPEVEDVIQQVINGLLGSLSPVWGTTPLGGNSSTTSSSSMSGSWEHEAGTDLPGNVPLQFQATVSASRDYLARLLFWCMLLGHHMRALEYRLELSRTFSLHADVNIL